VREPSIFGFYSVRATERGKRLREALERYDARRLLPRALRGEVAWVARVMPRVGETEADGGLYNRGLRGIAGVRLYDDPHAIYRPPFYFLVMNLELYDPSVERVYAEVAEALGAESVVITCDARVYVVEPYPEKMGADVWGAYKPVLPPREGGGQRMEDPAPDVYAASYEPTDDRFPESSPDYESGRW
jgi:hypothetical protein